KHLLAASMRLMEVGTKQQGMGRKEKAHELFQKAYDLYSLFWGINMKVINTGDIKEIDVEALNKHDQIKKEVNHSSGNNAHNSASIVSENKLDKSGNSNFMGKLGELVRKAVDCCFE
ncbi:MAG: hypothetical protein WA019_05300, partial [Candidatus Moraniibacteriota bacterium]